MELWRATIESGPHQDFQPYVLLVGAVSYEMTARARDTSIDKTYQT